MRLVTEYRERAQQCRKLARMVRKFEDKFELDRAAQSWERLAYFHERERDSSSLWRAIYMEFA
jgi:hypothetical protein